MNNLEKEFSENLARIYNKGAHRSGVEGCTRMIDENCDKVEVVGVFLKHLSDKGLL